MAGEDASHADAAVLGRAVGRPTGGGQRLHHMMDGVFAPAQARCYMDACMLLFLG